MSKYSGVALVVLLLVLFGGGLAMKKFNVGSWTATSVESLVYSKDSRTGICYAQGASLLATVPCDKVQHLID